METVCSSETSISNNRTSFLHNPQNHNMTFYRSENVNFTLKNINYKIIIRHFPTFRNYTTFRSWICFRDQMQRAREFSPAGLAKQRYSRSLHQETCSGQSKYSATVKYHVWGVQVLARINASHLQLCLPHKIIGRSRQRMLLGTSFVSR
jgi:hypothetical protein